MNEIITETLIDTLKALPYLFLTYLLLEFIQSRAGSIRLSTGKLDRMGPLIGAGVGCIPQCGFSGAVSVLYEDSRVRTGTLIAVFLATSDEAIPVLLSTPNSYQTLLLLVAIKFVVAALVGFLLNATLFSREKLNDVAEETALAYDSCETTAHHHHKKSVLKNALYHTVKISFYILVTLLFINLVVFFMGDATVSKFLLSGSVFQPFVTALIGLIPGCSISVLITQLLITGKIAFGSAVAGLCTGAGFGYLVIMRGKKRKKAPCVMAITYVFAALTGLLINFIF